MAGGVCMCVCVCENPGLVKDEICVTIICSLICKITSPEQISDMKNHQQIHVLVGANPPKFLYI